MSTFVVIAVVVAAIVAAFRFGTAYLHGRLDGEFPTVADGDYRNGFARSFYLLGRGHGRRVVVRRDGRRALTAARRNERQK